MATSAVLWTGSEWFAIPGVVGVTLLRDEGQIDSLVLRTVSGNADLLTRYPSAAVQVVLDQSGQTVMFQGYLDVGQPHTVALGTIDNRINLLAAPHVMRSSTARTWSNRKPQDIVMDIIRPYKLGLEMDASAQTLAFTSQTEGESDWALLARIADTIGYSLSHRDGVVQVIDVTKELRRAPNRGFRTLVVPGSAGATSNVNMFQATATTTPSGVDYRDTTMFGIDGLNQRFSYRTTFEPRTTYLDPEFTTQSTKTFTSLQSAVVEAKRIKQQARFTYTAKVGITGYTPAYPGRHVYVADGSGTYTGWWFVTNVSYSIELHTSSTYISMGKSAPASTGTIDVPPSRQPYLVLNRGHWQLDRDWKRVL